VCLRPFLAISIFLSSCGPPPPLKSERDDRNMAKTSKIRQNTCFGGQNAVNSCQKVLETPFSRAPINFLRFASDSPAQNGV